MAESIPVARVEPHWPDILARLAAGELIKAILDAYRLTRSDVRAYRENVPGAREQWDNAREQSADAFMDLALEEAFSNHDKDSAQHARTRIDTLKWAARIRNPRLYGDRAQLDVNVKTVDLTKIISDANARLAAARQAALPALAGEFRRIAAPAALEDLL